MDVLVFNNKYIDELLRANSESEEIYKFTREVILRYDYSYVNFVFNVFLTYSSAYAGINKEKSYLDIQESINKISKYKKNIIVDNILIVDIYDMLYNLDLPYTLGFCEGYFNYSLYDDMANRLTDICNDIDVYDKLEYVIKALSGMFATLDTKIINFVYSKNKDFDSSIVIYPEIVNGYLFLHIII